MDKNTVIGLTLIGAILIGFSVLNKPSEKERKEKQKEQLKELAQSKEDISNSKKVDTDEIANLPEGWTVKKDSLGNILKDANGQILALDANQKDTILVANIHTVSKVKEAKTINAGKFQAYNDGKPAVITTLENKLIKVELSSKGGKVSSVFLKPFESYNDFLDEQTHNSLQLFDDEGSKMSLVFKQNGQKIETGNLNFDIVKTTKNSVTYRLEPEDGKFIDFIYSIADSSYDVQFNVAFTGFSEEIDPKSVSLDLGMNFLLTEKQASQQRMVSTIFYETSDGYDYLSERTDDDAKLELPANWIAFKQSYFSSILIPENKFPVKGTSMKVRTFKDGNVKGNKYVKDYSAKINLGLNSTADGKVKMSWYFGPNDYKILSSYDKNLEDIINLGWGLFRWVNIYMIQPIYQVLINLGMGAGIAILVLTILIKLILTPVTWKMYVSSAKMRILKPQIEELALKFPKKEDAMKKQMETMALYRESGASPLSGCLPMLIQMPILFAVFRFFPSDFSIRQHGFLWANDLSTYDAIATWQQHIPILSSIYGNHISLFTLLMAATTLVYTHVNSGNMQQPTQQPGMPNMKVIMYIFPVMMIFFFNNYSAGLSYYYFISTLMSILIMYGIKIFFVDEEKLKSKMELRKANLDKKSTGSKKSKFQERLEAMQKQQQDRLKK